VAVTDLLGETRDCDPEREPDRCAMLRALFEGAPPAEAEFPATYKTFF
jgi:hypothetical protein